MRNVVISNDGNNPTLDVPVTFEVTPAGSQQSIELDFEDQNDWDMTFDPWTVLDEDGSFTYGFGDTEFPGMYDPMSYIAFNPATTTPPMTDDEEIQPHGGERFGACMASSDPTYENDDWLISPQIDLGMNSMLTFWVKSYTDEYGLEQYNVLVSTTDNDPEARFRNAQHPFVPTDFLRYRTPIVAFFYGAGLLSPFERKSEQRFHGCATDFGGCGALEPVAELRG